GNGVMPSRCSRSSTPVPPSASTRRIATVVSSVPEATSACSSTARLAAPPVPRINRDPNSRPAIVSFCSSTLHRRHHLHSCPVGQRSLPLRAGQHRPVHGNRDPPVGESHRLQQRRDRRVVGDLDRLVVHRDFHFAPTIAAPGNGAPLSSATIASA